MHCWLKLNGHPKWNLHIDKTVIQGTEKETDDPTDPTNEPPKKVIRRFWRMKWEEEKAKRESVAAKMTKRFEDILTNKEAYIKRSDIKRKKRWRSLTC